MMLFIKLVTWLLMDVLKTNHEHDPTDVAKLRIPVNWSRLIRRLMGLNQGRYQVVISVGNNGVEDCSVMTLGSIERLTECK